MEKQCFLPYGKQMITDDDINAVNDVLRSDWITQGPIVPKFEESLAAFLDAKEVIACANGTAALHLSVLALGIGEGDAIITTPNTFVSSANCARFTGADVIFADINSDTGLIDPESIARLLENDNDRKIKAIIPVHFAGQPANLPAIYNLAKRHGAWVIDDACHAIGATYEYNGRTFRLGGNPHSDMTVFSFHSVKHLATGEGGAVTTQFPELAEQIRLIRNHGITRQQFANGDMATSKESVLNPWYYEMSDLGFNYRLTDIQAALGVSQLKRLSWSLQRRREIANQYEKLIAEKFDGNIVRPLDRHSDINHAYHLFVVRIDFDRLGVSRAVVMNKLRANGIGTQVHYIPMHLQPYYRRVCRTGPGDFPQTEKYYATALSLPMYPDMTDGDIDRVISGLKDAVYAKEKSGVAHHH